MITVDHLRKRVEYLLGLAVVDHEQVEEAARFQDEVRAKASKLPPGEDSTALIRKWRDTRWSS